MHSINIVLCATLVVAIATTIKMRSNPFDVFARSIRWALFRFAAGAVALARAFDEFYKHFRYQYRAGLEQLEAE